jgi:hypothetical protein
MNDKVACTTCGAMILPTTAASNGGLCMPCKRGNRQNIEDGKRRHAERKHAVANPDPATLYWRWLIQQVYKTPEGFAGLAAEHQLYFAAVLLEGEVYNGGFEQYFSNSSADYYAHAERGLEAIGAAECRRLLVGAKETLFGARDVPDRAGRLARASDLEPEDEETLDELGQQFVREANKVRDLVGQFARKHALFEGA